MPLGFFCAPRGRTEIGPRPRIRTRRGARQRRLSARRAQTGAEHRRAVEAGCCRRECRRKPRLALRAPGGDRFGRLQEAGYARRGPCSPLGHRRPPRGRPPPPLRRRRSLLCSARPHSGRCAPRALVFLPGLAGLDGQLDRRERPRARRLVAAGAALQDHAGACCVLEAHGASARGRLRARRGTAARRGVEAPQASAPVQLLAAAEGLVLLRAPCGGGGGVRGVSPPKHTRRGSRRKRSGKKHAKASEGKRFWVNSPRCARSPEPPKILPCGLQRPPAKRRLCCAREYANYVEAPPPTTSAAINSEDRLCAGQIP